MAHHDTLLLMFESSAETTRMQHCDTTEYDPLEPNRRAIKAKVGRLRDPCSRVLDKRAEENGMQVENGERACWKNVVAAAAFVGVVVVLLRIGSLQGRLFLASTRVL